MRDCTKTKVYHTLYPAIKRVSGSARAFGPILGAHLEAERGLELSKVWSRLRVVRSWEKTLESVETKAAEIGGARLY